ncbi:hypothetical protein D3C76_628700 [compost metagenome]
MKSLCTQNLVEHHHIATPQQTDEHSKIQQCNKAARRLSQHRDKRKHIGSTHQRRAEITKHVKGAFLKNRQQIFADEHCVFR